MKKAMVGVTLVWGASLLGCEPISIDGGAEQPLQGPANALAWKGSDAQLPEMDPAPDALVLSLANVTQTECGFVLPGDPFTDCPSSEEWQLMLAIPPELARPALVSLDDPRILLQWIRHLGGCGGGTYFGNAFSGTLDIVSSDDTTLTVKLADTFGPFDGEYVAARCGTLPPAFSPTAAVAVPGSSLSGDPSSGTGPAADPDDLYVYLGTTPGTCAEPQPTVDCTEKSQMVLSLPPALQVPGQIALDDPQLGAVYTSSMNSCAATEPDAGTITILQASETSLTIRVFGSGWAALDGDYDVAICP